ncbi:MAG: MATE family efflux transporter, partial [Ignavibacteria bacterium]
MTQTSPQKQSRMGVDLLNGPIDSTLRIFALPLAFSFIVNMLYSWIDTFFVSKLGSAAIAAIGVSEQLGFMIFNFGSGFAIGTVNTVGLTTTGNTTLSTTGTVTQDQKIAAAGLELLGTNGI